MRAVDISAPGGPDVLRVIERPKPAPAAGEVIVAVKAAGVSRADSMQRQGKYPPPPGVSDIPGLEVAGILEQTGERVCALVPGGGYADYVAVPRELALPIPRNWDFVEAATLPENVFTVYDNVVTRAQLREGDSILVHGGSSGIGTMAIMLARAFGASFVAVTAGSQEKCDACLRLGADLAIDYSRADFVSQVHRATLGRGVDVILDMVGGDYIGRDLEALAYDGRIACIAAPRGEAIELNLRALMQRRAAIGGSSLRARTAEQKAAIAQELREHVWPRLAARDPIRPVVDSTFPLEDAPAAHRRLDSPLHVGKIVLTM